MNLLKNGGIYYSSAHEFSKLRTEFVNIKSIVLGLS